MTLPDLTRLEDLRARPGYDLLAVALQAAVPLQMQQLERLGEDDLLLAAETNQDLFQEHADVLQYGGPGAGKGFAALVTLLAIAARLAEGGVTALGLHWCATPGGPCCATEES